MAFDTAAKLSIAQILGWTVSEIDTHLITFAPTISAEAEAAVLSLIDQYNALEPDDGVEIFPNVANFGARVKNSYAVAQSRIKNSILSLINYSSGAAGGEFSTCLERG